MIKEKGVLDIADGALLVRAAVDRAAPVKPFPRSFRVLTYLPERSSDDAGAQLVYQAARAMPDVPFVVVGDGMTDPSAPANVEFCGQVEDMNDRIDSSTVLLRTPNHDGKPILILEALARARHVIWNREFPTVKTAKTLEEVVETLKNMRSLHDAGKLELNQAGRALVLEKFARTDKIDRFERYLESSASRNSRPTRARRRVAISGLDLFCADVSRYAKAFTTDWEPRLLRTDSRLDVLTSILQLAFCDVWYTIGSPITDRWLHMAARLLRKPRVIHWVGSDIAALCDHPEILQAVQSPNTIHLAEVDWTASQLREFGIEPQVAALPPRHCNSVSRPLPARFTVMLYVPRTRAAFYGQRALEHLMMRLSNEPIRYVVVGGGEISAPPGVEVENLGWRDNLDDVYERISVLIRYTPRDGLSLMVLEALSFGRHVLWTQNFPFTRRIHSYEDMEREVRDLLRAHERGELTPQTHAAQTVQRQYAPRTCTLAIARIWSEAANPRTKAELAAEPS